MIVRSGLCFGGFQWFSIVEQIPVTFNENYCEVKLIDNYAGVKDCYDDFSILVAKSKGKFLKPPTFPSSGESSDFCRRHLARRF